MSEPDLQALTQQAARELGIDVPIYHVQVVGRELRLHLPHSVMAWTLPGGEPAGADLDDYQVAIVNKPEMYSREELRRIVQLLQIDLPGRDWKKDLVKAINQWKEENDWTP